MNAPPADARAMDDTDRRLLDVIQSDYPLAHRPYAVVGDTLGITEDEVLERVRALKDSGVIRRIGASLSSRHLGWHSTLCAARVPEERLDEFVAAVNAHPGVTHNYLRDHDINVWFTYIGPDPETVQAALADIEAQTGIEILYLPATKVFKIKVDFKMNDNGDEAGA
jgi:siroheme decarboxylase